MRVTLTFDNGPHADVTKQVLDTLATHGVTATFFPLGQHLENPELLDLMTQARHAGHGVGNHTYSHPRPLGALPGPDAVAEISRTDVLLGSLREPQRLFRPSAGGGKISRELLNQAAIDHLLAGRHTLVMWDVVCEDWSSSDGRWMDRAWDRMQAQDWSLLVLHDIDSGAMDHLGTFLQRLENEGVEVRADFPPAMMPIVEGQVRSPLDHLFTPAADTA